MTSKYGHQIRKYRKLRGLTLQSVAEQVGSTPQTISRLETGAMTLSLDWLERLSVVLAVPPGILLAPHQQVEFTVLGTMDSSGRISQDPTQPVFAPISTIPVEADDPVAVRLLRSIGRYRAGDTLIGDRTYQPNFMPDHFCDCLIGLESGASVLRRLAGRDGAAFDLAEMKPGGRIGRGVEVIWIAPITMAISYLDK